MLGTWLRIRVRQCRVMGRQGLVHRVPSTKEMHFSYTVLVWGYKRRQKHLETSRHKKKSISVTGSHLRSSFCHSLPPLPELSVQQSFHAVPPTVSTQSFQLLQVVSLLHGQTFSPRQQAAPWKRHKRKNLLKRTVVRGANKAEHVGDAQLCVYREFRAPLCGCANICASSLWAGAADVWTGRCRETGAWWAFLEWWVPPPPLCKLLRVCNSQ